MTSDASRPKQHLAAAWAMRVADRWESVLVGGDALAQREKWLVQQACQTNTEA